MSQTTSIAELTQSIQVKDIVSFTLNTECLNGNFKIVKQCLLKIQQLESALKEEQKGSRDIFERLNFIQKDISKNKEAIDTHQQKITSLQGNIGDEFMKKIYDIEQKTNNTYGMDETIKKIESMNKFITSEFFKSYDNKVNQQFQGVNKMKGEFDRYVENTEFNQYKDKTQNQFIQNNKKINEVKEIADGIEIKVEQIDGKVIEAKKDVNQNNNLMKEINFNEMQDRIKKFKDDMEGKVGQMTIKLKKKAATGELNELEKKIIDKLDFFLCNNQRAKADKQETKDALQFLEKRINQIYESYLDKDSDEENDALFSTKKWNCASCARDLGKFEGKLGMFKPWSVFPCKELDPEKIGGYGYLNYVDKLSYKKGLTNDDQGLDRLNKTFFERNKDSNSPKKMNSTRTTNFMSNYGSEERQGTSNLKDHYFQDMKNREKSGAKLFRVKKQMVKVIGNSQPMDAKHMPKEQS